MEIRGTFIAIECSIVMSAVASVPSFAQSDSVPRANTPSLAAMRTATVMRSADDIRPTEFARVTLPPNLAVPDTYRSIVDTMLERSATFRRQCLRIANTSDLVIRLQSLNPYAMAAPRARSSIVRGPGSKVVAKVEIRPLDDSAELIAHEIEHVIEQLDGIDLQAQSSMPNTGVHWCPDGSYETIRAIRTGKQVAQEVRAGR